MLKKKRGLSCQNGNCVSSSTQNHTKLQYTVLWTNHIWPVQGIWAVVGKSQQIRGEANPNTLQIQIHSVTYQIHFKQIQSSTQQIHSVVHTNVPWYSCSACISSMHCISTWYKSQLFSTGFRMKHTQLDKILLFVLVVCHIHRVCLYWMLV